MPPAARLTSHARDHWCAPRRPACLRSCAAALVGAALVGADVPAPAAAQPAPAPSRTASGGIARAPARPGAAPARPQTAAGDTSAAYSSPALEALVARAAQRNRIVPAGLVSYRVETESELSLLIHRRDGSEGATQVEQVASLVRWDRSGALSQHVIGYRSRFSGPNISALALIKQAWIVPTLYGNRLSLFLGRDTTHLARRAIARDTAVRVVHPFAPDRDSVYRFSGGDTALTMRLLTRQIPVALVHVAPRPHLRRRTVLFHGDVYVDLAHAEIVRMRGAFEVVGGHPGLRARLQAVAYTGIAFVDLTNREIHGRFWLPGTQRIEGDVTSPLAGDFRSIFRVVTRFGAYTLDERDTVGSRADDSAAASDTMRALPHTLTIAPGDSLSGYSGWLAPVGQATTAARPDAFDDVAPEQWRPTGPPRAQVGTERIGDFIHYDRVEGTFTGVGGALRFRDAAPGLIARAHAGWAWTEQTVRGGASLEWLHGPWLLGAQASRTLDNTNDFRRPLAGGPFLEALLVQDDFDYVDRRSAGVYALHVWQSTGARDGGGGGGGGGGSLIVRVDAGLGDDRGDRARLTHGIFAPGVLLRDSLLRPNRGVLPGTYARGALTLDYHPGVDAGFVSQGLGVHLRYEAAGGELAWQRIEARVVADRTWGPFTALVRIDGGLVAGTVIPPQQLFEIGAAEGLLAYDYKQFAGDQAAIWQGEGIYALPFWQAPLRIAHLFLPSVAPGIAIGFQSGWTEASTRAARRALIALGSRVDPATNALVLDGAGHTIPVSSPSHGVRTSVNVLLRVFGGAAGIGVAHSLDPHAPFQAVLRLGAAL